MRLLILAAVLALPACKNDEQTGESAAYYQSIQTRNGRKDDECVRTSR